LRWKEPEVSEPNKQLARDLWDCMSNGDFARMANLYHADVAYHGSGGEERRGRQSAIDFAVAHKDAFPDFFGYVEQVVAEDDFVVSRVRTFGTNTGTIMGMPPSGRRVELRWIMSMMRIQDGQIAEEWAVFDQFDYMRQLGIIP
jgi:steroid delta-isomerase-like uncharacterized protein